MKAKPFHFQILSKTSRVKLKLLSLKVFLFVFSAKDKTTFRPPAFPHPHPNDHYEQRHRASPATPVLQSLKTSRNKSPCTYRGEQARRSLAAAVRGLCSAKTGSAIRVPRHRQKGACRNCKLTPMHTQKYSTSRCWHVSSTQ